MGQGHYSHQYTEGLSFAETGPQTCEDEVLIEDEAGRDSAQDQNDSEVEYQWDINGQRGDERGDYKRTDEENPERPIGPGKS